VSVCSVRRRELLILHIIIIIISGSFFFHQQVICMRIAAFISTHSKRLALRDIAKFSQKKFINQNG
jgi:hypothetical protein